MASEPTSKRDNPRAFFVAQAMLILVNVTISAAILFIAAGQNNWLAGWVYLVSYLLFNLVSSYLSIIGRKEVSMPEKGAAWEKVLYRSFRLTHPATLILAGLEFRFLYPYSLLPLAVQVSGFVLLFFAFGLIGWARAVNPYYSYEIPKQKQWEQEIVSAGPYGFIRHPGNLGTLLLALARPIALGSFYGLIPGAIGALISILQTFFEDRALQNGVSGYKAYSEKIKYRLMEYLW